MSEISDLEDQLGCFVRRLGGNVTEHNHSTFRGIAICDYYLNASIDELRDLSSLCLLVVAEREGASDV